MALLAFPKPQRSPLGTLLGANQREETARAVNSAILTAVGHPTGLCWLHDDGDWWC